MKVISFKVSEEDYNKFKQILQKQGLNFTKYLRPIIHDIASGNKQQMKYTKYTFKKNSNQGMDVSQIAIELEKIIEKIRNGG